MNHYMMDFERQMLEYQRARHQNLWKINEQTQTANWEYLTTDVEVKLDNQVLWNQFYIKDTEMIITKSGRRMFPSIQLRVSGLKKNLRYCIVMVMMLASERRHKYCGNSGGSNDENESKKSTKSNSGWSLAGPAELQSRFDRRVYIHPDSPALGEFWMENIVNFSKLKITNNIVDHHNHMVLTSMHKYIPIISIICCDDVNMIFTRNIVNYPAWNFAFNETEFIAVTAYQNEKIKGLKIQFNPFAKGFRETGQSKCKRRCRDQVDQNISSREYDEDGNSSGSESTRSLRLSNTTEESKTSEPIEVSENSYGNTCNKAESLPTAAADQLSKAEINHEEVPCYFYRPWVDRPFRPMQCLTAPTIPLQLMIPQMPSTSIVFDPNWYYHWQYKSLPWQTPLDTYLSYFYHYPFRT